MAPNAQTAVRVKGQIYAFGVWLLTRVEVAGRAGSHDPA